MQWEGIKCGISGAFNGCHLCVHHSFCDVSEIIEGLMSSRMEPAALASKRWPLQYNHALSPSWRHRPLTHNGAK